MIKSIQKKCLDKKIPIPKPTVIPNPLRLTYPIEENVKVGAIIVSFCEGSSYDTMFTALKQKAEEGTQTLVYAAGEDSVPQIISGFLGKSKNKLVKELVKETQSLDPDCVVFNWECCSFYSAKKFLNGIVLFDFIKLMLDRGHMLMFSDFSLKALINQWNTTVLGPLPFKNVDQYTGNVVLKFEPETLKNCPSAQLQLVGTLSDKGMCNVDANGGTIVYIIDKKVASKTKKYTLQLLTVASNVQGVFSPCSIGENSGAAGHCLLSYPSGGKILTSMTHWISLMDLDTSQKKLLEAAYLGQGQTVALQMEKEMKTMKNTEKRQYMKKKAIEYVQKSAPCNNKDQKKRKQK